MPFGNLFIQNLQTNPQFFFAVCITVVVSICVHELCHGFAAIWQGDRTPIETGHMTVNPVVHMGMMSVILLLVAGIAWGSMPVNPRRLRGRYSAALVALAGPASNVVLAAIALTLLGAIERLGIASVEHGSHAASARYFLWVFGYVNVTLAIFNLIPVPPLDGSRILANLIPAYGQLLVGLSKGGGISVAFFVVFFFAGGLIYPAAAQVSLWYLQCIRG
jgi:Zn-dependent protease